MKHSASLLLLSLFFSAYTVAEENTIQNQLPEGWHPIGANQADYNLMVSNEFGYSDRGLRIKSTEARISGFGGVTQSFSAEKFRGKTVRLSGKLKTIGVKNGYAGIWFRVDSKKEPLVLDNMYDRGVIGTQEWSDYFSVLYVEPSATKLFIGALLTGNGEVFVDDLEIEIVPNTTPVTAPSKTRNMPINLSF